MTTLIHDEKQVTTLSMTKTVPPDWLLAFWKEMDDKTFGAGFNCFAEDATCQLGIAEWHGREQIRENLRAFIDTGFTAPHDVVEYWDGGLLKVFREIHRRCEGGLARSDRFSSSIQSWRQVNMPAQEQVKEHELGDLLRYWRQQRGKSQLDLSLDTGVSQRHLSFVESGRSVPSRDLLLIVSEKLDIPLRERNVLLLASGYAPMYDECTWEAPKIILLTKAIDRVLLQQEPHPALVLDRYWNVIKTNQAAPRFFGSFVDLEARKRPRNLLDLMFDPAGMRPFVEDWELVAAGLLQRVYRESVGHVVDQKTVELLKSLERYPGVKDLNTIPKTQSPVLPITFTRGNERFSYFSLITTVGTPQFVTAQELRIECMFPIEAGVK